MKTFVSLQQINDAAEYVSSRIPIRPKIGLILGSGLSKIADSIEHPTYVEYQEIPHWPTSSIQGHHNRLVVGKLAAQDVIIMQGRVHFYEGYEMDEITMPVRVMQKLGMEIMIVTNAAGAINPAYVPGDIMLIEDLLSLVCMGGNNPLRGPNLEEFGPRFPDMSQMMDRDLMAKAQKAAAQLNIPLQTGVYVGLAGPSFESPADLRYLRTAGADAVGMSTVPESIVARHGGIRVLGFSGITNKANLDGNTLTTHEEVLEAGEQIAPNLQKIILGVLGEL